MASPKHIPTLTAAQEEKFWAHVQKNAPNGCWLWSGSTHMGYGYFMVGRVVRRAHRVSYLLLRGEVLGETLDHLCRNRACVNPEHLEPVTNRENLRRGESFSAINARKTHCPRGHEYTAETTYLHRNQRHCKVCLKMRDRHGEDKRGYRKRPPRKRMPS